MADTGIGVISAIRRNFIGVITVYSSPAFLLEGDLHGSYPGVMHPCAPGLKYKKMMTKSSPGLTDYAGLISLIFFLSYSCGSSPATRRTVQSFGMFVLACAVAG